MLKNNTLTYISLFSSAGVGCYGFQMEDYQCIATNELLPRRLDIQRINHKCKYDSGYIAGDITTDDVKQRIYDEIHRWEKESNDRVDVVVATPPCQGISVINHKKSSKEIHRNSLVVESVEIIAKIKPRFLFLRMLWLFRKHYALLPMIGLYL